MCLAACFDKDEEVVGSEGENGRKEVRSILAQGIRLNPQLAGFPNV